MYTIFLTFITEIAKGSKEFPFLSITNLSYLVITPNSRINKNVGTQFITTKISTHKIDLLNKTQKFKPQK